jgi:hypothetical protein
MMFMATNTHDKILSVGKTNRILARTTIEKYIDGKTSIN